LLCEYESNGFIGRIHDFGSAKPLAVTASQKRLRQVLIHHWCQKPPRTLCDIYRSSRPLLHEQLDDKWMDRLHIAIDSPKEREVYAAFRKALPAIRLALSNLPLFVQNPRISRNTLIPVDSGQTFVVNWGLWKIEPIGVGLGLNRADQTWLQQVVEQVTEQRRDAKAMLPEHILLANLISEIDRLAFKAQLKAAVNLLPRVMQVMNSQIAPVETTAS
jgi:hypothetical protein